MSVCFVLLYRRCGERGRRPTSGMVRVSFVFGRFSFNFQDGPQGPPALPRGDVNEYGVIEFYPKLKIAEIRGGWIVAPSFSERTNHMAKENSLTLQSA